ncbi:hypothetical protein Lepto7376_3504 [[Leptolyngbya] sp. PCC 7376]|uniref:hypothetical protein n=1 Tax=[Leptolyngbya] sp. PCC 7376 TaxID=111781 RepID=UPI00029EC709|nr:hypothetical protein [[Leptolyngbya] sp. PCC 7376]AFY39701.1 hypothetical protein Lepto7376_3504 [[Leptolyngbya] sp. PCC 7376]
MTTENTSSTASKTTTTAKTTRSRSTAKKETKEVTALSVKEPTKLGLPNNRPIEPSHLKVTSTYKSVGADRPVTAGTMEISSTMTISGNRPIAASLLQVSDTFVMGKRPVAPNETDDIDILIGYLD